MTETANESMTAAEYRRKYGGESQPSLDGLGAPADEYDQALAIDPGADTGVAYTNGREVQTGTTDWWELVNALSFTYIGEVLPGPPFSLRRESDLCIILEAPYKSRQSMGRKPAVAYNSGQVAREAELLAEWIREQDYGLIEHDPSQQGRKWDDDFARKIVGDWEGPSNEHCRDALRLLFFYDFL